MRPFPGFSEATLPGGRAWRKERDYLERGIPLSAEAVRSLTSLADEAGFPTPWREGIEPD